MKNCCKCGIELSNCYVVEFDEAYCYRCYRKTEVGELIENLSTKIYNMIEDDFGDLYPTSYYNEAMYKINDALYSIVRNDIKDDK